MTWWRVVAFVMVLTMFWVVVAQPDEQLHLVFCDVGQGDASLITKGSFQMLIDTGPKKGGVMECLTQHIPFWDKKIEVVVNTHPQADHFGEMGEILNHYQVGEILVSGESPDGKAMEAIFERIKLDQIKQIQVARGDHIRYGDLSFDIYWPSQKVTSEVLGASSDDNEGAVVLMMRSSAMTALFTSDIGENQELALEEMGVLEPVDVLKVAHHGSKFSSSSTFDEAVRPKWAVVSVGEKNSYGHPNPEILRRFDTLGSSVLRTDKDGEIEFVADKDSYRLKK